MVRFSGMVFLWLEKGGCVILEVFRLAGRKFAEELVAPLCRYR